MTKIPSKIKKKRVVIYTDVTPSNKSWFVDQATQMGIPQSSLMNLILSNIRAKKIKIGFRVTG